MLEEVDASSLELFKARLEGGTRSSLKVSSLNQTTLWSCRQGIVAPTGFPHGRAMERLYKEERWKQAPNPH